jgi:hypothetical protein
MGFFQKVLADAITRQIMQCFTAKKPAHKKETSAEREIKEIPPKQEIKEKEEQEQQPQGNTSFSEQEYKKALQLYDKAQADKEYQRQLTQYFNLITRIKETYSTINSVGSFSGEEGNRLIQICAEAISIEADIREKREYYENCTFDMSPICKTLAMIFEKRLEYQRAATICVYAIQNGYTSDGTSGGMRGRLARMIKKGNLPLTDSLKNILDL